MYLTRRQGSGFKFEGRNENFLKSEIIDIPDELRDLLPNQGIRLALRNSTGFYKGITPYMVSVYLVPRNNAASQDRILLETMVLTNSGDREDQLEPLHEETRNNHPTAKEVRRAVHDYNIKEILDHYLSEGVLK